MFQQIEAESLVGHGEPKSRARFEKVGTSTKKTDGIGNVLDDVRRQDVVVTLLWANGVETLVSKDDIDVLDQRCVDIPGGVLGDKFCLGRVINNQSIPSLLFWTDRPI